MKLLLLSSRQALLNNHTDVHELSGHKFPSVYVACVPVFPKPVDKISQSVL